MTAQLLHIVISGCYQRNLRTRCSAIAERPRCRVRYSFRQKWKTEMGDNILWTIYLQPLWYNRPENQSNSVKRKTQNKDYYGVQGHSRSSIEVGTSRKPVCDFQLVTNSNWHNISYTVSQLIVQILDTLRFW